MRIVVDRSCFLETSTHLQETKLKVVVLLLSSRRVERDKTLGEIVNSQLLARARPGSHLLRLLVVMKVIAPSLGN
jgi:hypothetical protein